MRQLPSKQYYAGSNPAGGAKNKEGLCVNIIGCTIIIYDGSVLNVVIHRTMRK